MLYGVEGLDGLAWALSNSYQEKSYPSDLTLYCQAYRGHKGNYPPDHAVELFITPAFIENLVNKFQKNRRSS